jgi:outer membrane receptor for ferrienterochelin and colicin
MARKMFFKLALTAIALVMATAAAAIAQTGGTGNITGVVSDPQGAVVKGATVTLTSKATNQSQTITTSDDGVYNFVLLAPGTYTVKTTATSFGASTLEVAVQVGRTTDANVTMTAAGVNAVVEVTADKIQTTSSNFDTVQSESEIQNAPINGRRFQDFVTLTPTAQVDPSRGQISLAGQRGINTNVNVDGVDYNQPFFGGIRGGERSNSAFTIPQESIKEFQVVATGYSAEFGRSSGGIVNAVTKSGTNQFHGSGFVVTRPSGLALGNEFTDALKEQKLDPLNIPLTIAPTQHMWGGSIGGPIAKDRLFFFASYEQQKLSVDRSVAYTLLSGYTPLVNQQEPFNTYAASRTGFRQTNDATTYLGKIDWNINNSNRFNIRYNHSKNTALNGVSTGETSLDPTTFRSLVTNGTEGDENNIVVGQLVSNFTSRSINEVRAQWADEKRPRLANGQQVSVTTGIGELGTRTFLPTTQEDKRYQLIDTMTFITGNHTFKFGGEGSKIKVSQAFGFNQFGNYAFSGVNTANDILNALATTGPTVPGKIGRFDLTGPLSTTHGPTFGLASKGSRFNQQIGNLQAAFDVTELAFFGQDSWRVTPKLTLNYGLRYERQFNPSAQANNAPVINAIRNTAFPLLGGHGVDPTQIPDSKHEWAPRLGFAYDLNGNGKTVLRAYTGIYYARTPAIVLAAPFNNFRDPAGDLSVQLGPGFFAGRTPTTALASNFNFAQFFANNPSYSAITGLTAAQCANAGNQLPSGDGTLALWNQCAPITVFRQFAVLGINLNNFNLTNLPSLSAVQLGQLSDRLLAPTGLPPSPFGLFQGAQPIGINPEFQNPVSYQFGGGFEREQWRNVIIGVDFAWVKTIHLERNIDINLPAPGSFDPATQRPIYNRNNRPILGLGSIQLRDSSANQLYKEVTGRIRYNSKRLQMNAFYTWSRNLSDDDNERDSGGVLYDDPFSRTGEYYASRLDRTHQFVANPIFYMPHGVEFSSNVRLRSGSPLNALVGSDLNGDNNSGNERPYLVPGLELPRNYYRNRPIYDVDVRAQKRFTFKETRSFVISAEVFNVLRRSNLQLFQGTSGGSPTLFCAGGTLSRCGLDGPTNPNFMQLRDQRPGATFGKINLLNTPGSQPFQVQFGARMYF